MTNISPTSSRNSCPGRPLVVGLVNNTSDRALRSTEAQFSRLLCSAAHEFEVELRFFTCPEILRSAYPRSAAGEPYDDISQLFTSRVDALVVTGMEPQEAELQDEPVWFTLTRLVDWAEDHGVPTIWSCLAAHAAVLHLDGISRTRQPRKISDMFECDLVSPRHPLMAGLPQSWSVPHSRYYGVAEQLLTANGYQVLSRAADAGADVFVRETGARFVFFQGHPEYDAVTLSREYTRDVRRYLSGERDDYPIAPRRYCGPIATRELRRLRQMALEGGRDPDLLAEISGVMDCIAPPARWDGIASRIYANWLTSIVQPDSLARAADPLHLDMVIGKSEDDSGRRVAMPSK